MSRENRVIKLFDQEELWYQQSKKFEFDFVSHSVCDWLVSLAFRRYVNMFGAEKNYCYKLFYICPTIHITFPTNTL